MLRKLSLTLLSFIVLCSINTQAQLEPNSVAANFALNDVDGNLHVLYDYLDDDKPVFISVFAVWSPAAWFYSESIINSAAAFYGQDGDNSITFLAIEADDATEDNLSNNNSYGDWASLLNFPIINQSGNFAGDYAIANYGTSYPTFYMVYPNRLVSPIPIDILSVGVINDFANPANYNFLSPGGTNNVGIVSYDGDEIYCQDISPTFTVQNLGSQILTSFDATLTNNGEVIGTQSWTGSIASYELTELDFGTIETEGTAQLELAVSNPNGTTDDFLAGNTIARTVEAATNIGEGPLQLNLTTDLSPGETSWVILDSEGNIVYQSEGLDASTSYEYTFDFFEEGCYLFVVLDAQGDGLSSFGSVISLTHNGTVLFDETDFGFGTTIPFEVDFPPVPITVSIDSYNVDENGVLTITASSNDEITDWSWSFGNGGTGSGQSATYAYTENGTYTVTLTATGSEGQIVTVQQTIEVVITVEFNAFFNYTQDNLTVTVTDNSLNGESWSWDFGDGTTAEGQTVVPHTYAADGTYDICLTVTNGNNTDEHCETVAVMDITSIEDIKTLTTTKISPNPAQNQMALNIKTPENTEIKWNLKNIIGQNLTQPTKQILNTGENQINIPIQDLSNGIYFLQIQINNTIQNKKFVIAR